MFGSTLNSNSDRDLEPVRSKLYVKYMVCLRDKMTLKSVLEEHGINCRITVHGAIECLEDITDDQYYKLKGALAMSGFVLLDKNESMLIDQIINTIVEVVHNSDRLPRINFSDIISKYVISGEDNTLKIFSDVKGMSVLQFIVTQKIERAKELMLYEDKSLAEIAEILNYKNEDFLVAQFKKTTGLKPSYFKRLKNERMKIAEDFTSSTRSDTSETGS